LKDKINAMESRIIKQAITEDSLFRVVTDWFLHGAGRRGNSIKILSAFVSGKGVEAITPFVDVFLADGNDFQLIFGIDRGGTDRAAIRRLFALQNAHVEQFSASYFNAQARGSIFHPKLYIHEYGNRIDCVIGSSNLTYGGLGSNLESLILFENLSRTSQLARQVLEIWSSFESPDAPLPANSLMALTTDTVATLQTELPERTQRDKSSGNRDVRDLWEPLSRIPLPRSGVTIGSNRRVPRRRLGQYLIMDVLQETRETQMQIPLPIIEGFFGIGRDQEATIRVSIITDDGLTQPIERSIVISGLEYNRLMRRLEMPQIRRLTRPLAVVFIKLPGQLNFAYYLIRQELPQYEIINRILEEDGQQGNATRRYYVGRRNDQNWTIIGELLGLE
jgi:HKD family nuclease